MKDSRQNRILGAAGLALILLGTLSLFLVYLTGEANAQSIQLAAGTGVLFGLGGSTAAATGVRRLEARVAKLEAALAARG